MSKLIFVVFSIFKIKVSELVKLEIVEFFYNGILYFIIYRLYIVYNNFFMYYNVGNCLNVIFNFRLINIFKKFKVFNLIGSLL